MNPVNTYLFPVMLRLVVTDCHVKVPRISIIIPHCDQSHKWLEIPKKHPFLGQKGGKVYVSLEKTYQNG
jgi:hypothetical protein